MGFTRGFSVGEEAGWRDGYIFGVRKGAQLSAEIGYYQGFSHAWIAILEREDTNKQRKLGALYSLLELTRGFPKTNNLLEDDAIQKLARIRAKFKQVNALILGHGQIPSTFPQSTPAPTVVAASIRPNIPRRQSPAPPGAQPAAKIHRVHIQRPVPFAANLPHKHSDMFNRGPSWTSQDSNTGIYKRSISPGHKTEMSF